MMGFIQRLLAGLRMLLASLATAHSDDRAKRAQKLANLLRSDPQKAGELAAFYWCMLAAKVDWDRVVFEEQPDFVMSYCGSTIGVEITEAHREGAGVRNARAIEATQEWFGERLVEQVKPALPIEIGLCCEDNVIVDKRGCEAALASVAQRIDEVTAQMKSHSVAILVRNLDDMPNSKHSKHACPELPDFLQHIQLFNDGHSTTSIMSWRGIIVESFTLDELNTILGSKHRKLHKYADCDEHWLVIVSGLVPQLIGDERVSHARFVSLATTFGGIDFETPVESEFDRVYFFRSPNDAKLLTEQP